MKHNILKISALCLSLLLYNLIGSSQTTTSKFEVGAGISSFIYQGDLTPNRFGSYKTIRFGFHLNGSLILSPSFLARTNITVGSLHGNDAAYENPEFRQQRNFNFKTPVIELSELLVWNPMRKNYEEKGFSPYVMGGIGITLLNIKSDSRNFNPDYFLEGPEILARIEEDIAQGTPKLIPVVPVGAGIRYNITPAISVYAESAYRLMFTDYLDGFSKAANPKYYDHYQTITAGIIYRPGSKGKLACPAVSY